MGGRSMAAEATRRPPWPLKQGTPTRSGWGFLVTSNYSVLGVATSPAEHSAGTEGQEQQAAGDPHQGGTGTGQGQGRTVAAHLRGDQGDRPTDDGVLHRTDGGGGTGGATRAVTEAGAHVGGVLEHTAGRAR